MKKFLSMILVAMLIFTSAPIVNAPVSAAPDPLAAMFENQLWLLDEYYDYNYDYMIRIATDEFVTDDYWNGNVRYVTASAQEFEAVLYAHFAIDEKDIEAIREYGNQNYSEDYYDEFEDVHVKFDFYDAETNTYSFGFYGGFGGGIPERAYLGYVANGDTYDVYFQHITYQWLESVYEGDMDYYDYIDSLGWPDNIEYGENVYENIMGDYGRIVSYDGYGRKYTVELNGDTVRIISCSEYGEGDAPNDFDDTEIEDQITYNLPADGSVTVLENECFEHLSVVDVERVESGSKYNVIKKAALELTDRFTVYSFFAFNGEDAADYNGALPVVFNLSNISNEYSDNVEIYFLDGPNLKKVESTVDADTHTVAVGIEKSGYYVLVDADCPPHEHEYSETTYESTCTVNGYTIYTCKCGHSYNGNFQSLLPHNYVDGACTSCGKADPWLTAPTLTLSGGTAYRGKTVRVEMYIENNVGIMDFKIPVIFDHNALELVSVESDTLGYLEYGISSDDEISIYAMKEDKTPFYENGMMLTITFRVNEGAAGDTTAVKIAQEYAYGTDEKGNEVVFKTVDAELSVKDLVMGDLSGEGKVEKEDLEALMRYINFSKEEIIVEAADLNGDGKINNKDFGLLQRYLAGWDVKLG